MLLLLMANPGEENSEIYSPHYGSTLESYSNKPTIKGLYAALCEQSSHSCCLIARPLSRSQNSFTMPPEARQLGGVEENVP